MKLKRSPSGISMVVMTLIIALLIVFVAGLFAFELNRVEVARAQLRSATEAASLSAVATLASQQSGNTLAAHTAAQQAALSTFQRNEVMGVQFDGQDPDDVGVPAAIVAPGNPYNPPIAKEASLFTEFMDPNNNNQVVAPGNPAGKSIRCWGTFHYVPAFGVFVGVGDTYLRTVSTGGVPDLDVVLTFDVSGSIDDQTPVTFVKRFQKRQNNAAFVGDDSMAVPNTPPPPNGSPQAQGTANRYWITNKRPGAPVSGNKAQGRLFDILKPAPVGTGVNAYYPQNLAAADDTQMNNYFGQPYHAYPLSWRSQLRGNQNNALPGNDPNNGSTADEYDQYSFTDLVVNLDGNTTFNGGVYGGFNFPNVAVLVEAARGNLESDARFTASGAKYAFSHLPGCAGITPGAGYQQAYLNAAKEQLQPISDARDAATDFFTLMNTNTKGHFSFVSFSSASGTPGGTYGPINNIDGSYGQGGSMSHPQPLVRLNPSVTVTGYQACLDAINTPPLVATGGTNIGDSIDAALDELQNRSRPNSKKAIVVFTDGMPNTPGGETGGQNFARQKALECQTAGIPIYSIGLAQNADIIPHETAILTDANTSPANGGISGIAGNGGRFFLATNSADLKKIFGNIARSLCGLIK